MTLTEHLLNLDSYRLKKATQDFFLQQAGKLTITPRNLKGWMCQARLFTGNYVQMIGDMISKLPLYSQQRDVDDSDASYSEERAKRILRALTQALSHVTRKSDLLTEYLNREPYIGQFKSLEKLDSQTDLYGYVLSECVRTGGYDLSEALVAVWTMEIVTLRAWEYAKKFHVEDSLQEKTIHTETCNDLTTIGSSDSVDTFASLVNEIDTRDPERMAKMEDVYKDILDNEYKFWQLAYHQTSY